MSSCSSPSRCDTEKVSENDTNRSNYATWENKVAKRSALITVAAKAHTTLPRRLSMRSTATLVLTALLAVQLAACSAVARLGCAGGCEPRRSHADGSSSLVEFLYPKGEAPPAQNAKPQLSLPLRVGLAFLPARGGGTGLGPDAVQRDHLLQAIAARFKERRFIASVVTIPDYYLRPDGANLESLQRLYQVDVLALVSYDQIGYESDLNKSWTYLTIIGAFVVNGTRNEASTLVDLAVVEPRSRALLLRAGGTDLQARDTNWVDSATDQRLQARAGYSAATARMVDNFDAALKQFEIDVQQQRAPVEVSWRGGGGAMGGGALAALLLAALAQGVARRYNGALLFGTRRHANSRRSTHL
ncbi:MAG: rhombotarget lipoprotein [Proteobacteria bacterium]|nr:rhombotarget lipoprotein [Pseudomonadota bacterium]